MSCAWDSYASLLPIWMRETIENNYKDTIIEVRLRLGQPPELITVNKSIYLNRVVSEEDLAFSINVASKYSPWSSATVSNGFITTAGGHRVGVCGYCATVNDCVSTIRFATSISIRIAKDFSGISKRLFELKGSTLILGKPGCGKTTLLRDLIRNISDNLHGSICVVDEKCEIYPLVHNRPCFATGMHTDIVSGCTKEQGIEMVLRNMGPKVIAVDEITSNKDCSALLHAGWCGVRMIATAHAEKLSDLYLRPVYKPIAESKLFDNFVVMREDRSWSLERME